MDSLKKPDFEEELSSHVARNRQLDPRPRPRSRTHSPAHAGAPMVAPSQLLRPRENKHVRHRSHSPAVFDHSPDPNGLQPRGMEQWQHLTRSPNRHSYPPAHESQPPDHTAESTSRKTHHDDITLGPFQPALFIPRTSCSNCGVPYRLQTSAPTNAASFRPTTIYACKGCAGRPLCERCAREVLFRPNERHKPDHFLVEIHPNTQLDLHQSSMGREPVAHMLQTLQPVRKPVWLIINSPPGLFEMSVQFVTSHDPDRTSSSAVGFLQASALSTHMKKLGTIKVEVGVVNRDLNTYSPQTVLDHEFVRESSSKHDVVKGSNLQCSLKALHFKVQRSEIITLRVKAHYDRDDFEYGCPYTWCLQHIR